MKLLSMPFISYNSLPTLRLLIRSLLDNTINWNDIEILIVDNHSTDGSVDFLKKSEINKYCKIIYLDKNYGLWPAINISIVESSGEYVGYGFSDDMVMGYMWDKIILDHLAEYKFFVPRRARK